MSARGRLIFAVLALATAGPGVAQAHLVASGMGPIYDGITHFGLSPEDYLSVIAVRVSGSWLAAAGLLPAGWVWRYGARVAGS